VTSPGEAKGCEDNEDRATESPIPCGGEGHKENGLAFSLSGGAGTGDISWGEEKLWDKAALCLHLALS
jgi:hypothetical protein